MPHKILIADPDDQSSELLKMMFEEHFALTFATTAAQIERYIAEQDFHFVLLEHQLPDADAMELLNRIQISQGHLPTACIILSDNDDETVIRAAYELGVSDYLTKPYNVIALHERLLQLSKDIDRIEQLEQRDSKITSIAEQAMKQATYYGKGMELMAHLSACTDVNVLAQTIISSLSQQGYCIALQFRFGTDVESYDQTCKPCGQIELDIFNLLKDKGRIYRFGKRCIYNDEHVSLLVKNMPSANTASYDALIDLAAKLVPAVDGRYIAILEHQSLLGAKQTLTDALHVLSKGIADIENSKVEVMEQIKVNIGMSFHHLNLDEEQEGFLMSLIEKEIAKTGDHSSLDELNKLIETCISTMQVEVKSSPPPLSPQDSSDIELF